MQPDADEPLLPAPPPEGDDVGWLITFSDLVLQLFGFVLVWAVLSVAPKIVAPTPAVAIAAVPSAVTEPAAEPATRRTWLPPPAAEPAPAPEPAAPTAASVEWEAPDEPIDEPAPTVEAQATPEEPNPALVAAADALAALAGGSEAVSVARGAGDVVLSLGEAVSFAPGGTDLADGARPILAGVRHIADAMPDLRIEVVGHTDDRPIRSPRFPSNLELSLARAAQVAHELAGGDAALGARIVASGQGEHSPVASNEDAAGRARNRRVEIRLRPTG